jgi:hypothetical protein
LARRLGVAIGTLRKGLALLEQQGVLERIQGSGTYVRLSCADTAGAYVLAESLGATFTAQWIVTFKGNFAGCASPCPTDIDGNGSTGASDLSALLNGWGTSSPDLNGDGVVGAADLSALLNGWGACP